MSNASKKLTAREVKLLEKATADLQILRDGIATRINFNGTTQKSVDLARVSKTLASDNFVTVLFNCLKQKLDYSKLIENLAVCEKGQDFIANKVLVKIICLMQAIAGNAHNLDGYTKAVLFNLEKGNNDMTVFEIQQAVSRAVVNDNNAHRLCNSERHISNVKDSSIGTSASQSSSSRMCLMYLNIASTVKGKKDAPLTILKETNNGKAFTALSEKLFSNHGMRAVAV
jgi:hypothetical protein